MMLGGINNMKKCNKCKNVYDKNMFVKCKASKDGLKTICKKCLKEYRLEYYRKNKEEEIKKATNYNREHRRERLKYGKKYRLQNRDVLNEKVKKYYIKHKDERKCYSMKYYYEHKEERNECSKKWKLKNREKLREYEKNKLKNDINYKISAYMRNRVRCALRAKGSQKTKHTESLIGCSFEFLRSYLESKFYGDMKWENYGYYGWHIDHIRPCSSFDLTVEEQQKECFHYTNLQPLWWKDNLSKSDKVEW